MSAVECTVDSANTKITDNQGKYNYAACSTIMVLLILRYPCNHTAVVPTVSALEGFEKFCHGTVTLHPTTSIYIQFSLCSSTFKLVK